MNAWRDLARLPRELWLLCAATLVNRLGTMALPFLPLYITDRLGFSAARAGVALAVYGAVALLVAPLAGRLADRRGAWRTILVSLVASGVFLLCYPLVRTWAAVLAMTALFAAANESFRPANLALVGELGSAEHRKAAFALNRLAVNLGMSVGPAVGGFLAQVSFPALFVADGLTTLAAAAVLVCSSFPAAMKVRERSRPAAGAGAAATSAGRGIFAALRDDRSLRVFLLGVIPVAIVFFQHESSLPLYLVRDLGFSASSYGLLFTINTLMILAFEIPLNARTANWPHHRSLALGSLLFALGFGALALARSHLAVALTVVVWTCGEMILFPSMAAHVSDLAPEGRGGEYMGFYSMAFSFAFMAGPVTGTVLLERLGAVALWLSMLGLGLVSAVVLGRRPRVPPPG